MTSFTTTNETRWWKRLIRELRMLEENRLPFRYSISFDTPIVRNGITFIEETATFQKGNTIFVDVTVEKDVVSTLKRDYKDRITFFFTREYPIREPCVTFEKPLLHDFLDEDGEMDLTNYAATCYLSELITNAYCVLVEALADEINCEFVRDWNNEWTKTIHKQYRDLIINLALLELPSYVLLWILDWLPEFYERPEINKIRLIENVYASCDRAGKRKTADTAMHTN